MTVKLGYKAREIRNEIKEADDDMEVESGWFYIKGHSRERRGMLEFE